MKNKITKFWHGLWQGVKNVASAITKWFKAVLAPSSAVSSIRLVMLLCGVVFVFLLYLFTLFCIKELKSETSNYAGLSQLWIAMFISFWLVVFAKVFQKKYEK